MAKGTGKGREPESVTLSARMDPRQRRLIEEAAKAVDCAPGKFVRDAAVRRAADVLNAAGGAEAQLRELARRFVDHSFHCRVVVKGAEKTPCLESGLYEPQFVSNEVGGGQPEPEGEWVSRPKRKTVQGIRRAFETAPLEFVRLFLEEWDRWGKDDTDYEPRVDPDEVLD